jgi:catechol 2,3-dioxygenase-like lactoylglutathione lyase family enzyme
MTRLDHITLPVRDWRASRDWWTAQLGFQVEFEIEGGVAVRDEADLTVFLVEGPVLPTPDIAFTVQVDDVEKRCAAIGVAGAPIVHPPQRVFWGYGAEVLDPDGYRIRLWDPASMNAKGAA